MGLADVGAIEGEPFVLLGGLELAPGDLQSSIFMPVAGSTLDTST